MSLEARRNKQISLRRVTSDRCSLSSIGMALLRLIEPRSRGPMFEVSCMGTQGGRLNCFQIHVEKEKA